MAKQDKPTGKHQTFVPGCPGSKLLILEEYSKRKAVATSVTTAFRMKVSND